MIAAGTGKAKSVRVAATVAGTLIVGVAALAAGVGAASMGRNPVEGDRIAAGVRIGDAEVGGLTRDEAAERARTWARDAVSRPLTLVAPKSGRRWNLSLHDVGGRFELAPAVEAAYAVGRTENWLTKIISPPQKTTQITPEFKLDQSQLRKRLAEIGKTIHIAPRNARAKMSDGALIVSTPERKGIALDVDATTARVLKNGVQPLAKGATAEIVVTEEMPKVTSDDLGAVGTLLGSYTTDYSSSSSNRQRNVELAASHIDGTLLGPGESFSYNDTVGPREAGLGWRMAHQFQDGQVVDGIGGGVCQVSSTLYNAVLLSGLKIVERSHHSMPVAYVRAGRDATVSYDAIDFKFQNSTGSPIYVAARAHDGRLTLAIYGDASEKSDVRIVSSGRRYNNSGGFSVSTARIITRPDGSTVEESLSSDTYRPPAPKQTASTDAPRRRRRKPASSPSPVTPTAPTTASTTSATPSADASQ